MAVALVVDLTWHAIRLGCPRHSARRSLLSKKRRLKASALIRAAVRPRIRHVRKPAVQHTRNRRSHRKIVYDAQSAHRSNLKRAIRSQSDPKEQDSDAAREVRHDKLLATATPPYRDDYVVGEEFDDAINESITAANALAEKRRLEEERVAIKKAAKLAKRAEREATAAAQYEGA